jgi:hypothetical protein
MVITNNTQHETVYYSVSRKGGADCGNLGPGEDVTLATYDNTPNVKVTLRILKTGDNTEVIMQDSGL